MTNNFLNVSKGRGAVKKNFLKNSLFSPSLKRLTLYFWKLIFFQCITFIICWFDEHVNDGVASIFVVVPERPLPLLEVTQSSDELDEEVPVQVLPQLVEHEKVAQRSRSDEVLNLLLFFTCSQVPAVRKSSPE